MTPDGKTGKARPHKQGTGPRKEKKHKDTRKQPGKGKYKGGRPSGPGNGQGPRRGGLAPPQNAPRSVVPLGWPHAYRGPKGVLTKNPKPGVRVYGERLIPHKHGELRAWNPRRSKLAALLLATGTAPFPMEGDERALYLGAASGTTVSHLADILERGRVVAVEKSPRSFRDLMGLARSRDNVDPVLSDARDPDALVALAGGPMDILYQDVAQRDQDLIFINMANRFLRPGGWGVIMVKARSVSVAREPDEVYDDVTKRLQENGFRVTARVPLEPWEKDHAAILVQRGD